MLRGHARHRAPAVALRQRHDPDTRLPRPRADLRERDAALLYREVQMRARGAVHGPRRAEDLEGRQPEPVGLVLQQHVAEPERCC